MTLLSLTFLFFNTNACDAEIEEEKNKPCDVGNEKEIDIERRLPPVSFKIVILLGNFLLIVILWGNNMLFVGGFRI